MATRANRHLEVTDPAGAEDPRIAPLNPVIGAEIGGVDLSRPLPKGQFAEIEAAFNAHTY